MHTRFTQLVKYKNNEMQQCEQKLFHANSELVKAQEQLQCSYQLLHTLEVPKQGDIETLLQSRCSFSMQRNVIRSHAQRVKHQSRLVEQAKEELKASLIEYEKFQYLEAEQIKKMIKKQKREESKSLDEAALQTFISRAQ
ncbi:MAG: hypothetical protein DSZ03_04275 [Sulfurimonas sp.]|nr:MAG: hypothetical protein DSZ03_04275 [Sulfurimonas sp.]